MLKSIQLKNVQQNNLNGFDLNIPQGKLIVVTGLSGTGKSSLVFETIHAEGQRRYVETFSPYARQFLELLDKPKVDAIENIRPSIAIKQGNTVKTSRSTVGTMTELCDYFKIWFCHNSELFDPSTNKVITTQFPPTIWKTLNQQAKDHSLLILFKLKKPENISIDEMLTSLKAQGYSKIYHNNDIYKINSFLEKEKQALSSQGHFFVIQDKVSVVPKNKSRFIESATTAFSFGKGELHIFDLTSNRQSSYHQTLQSPQTGRIFKNPSPALFSFNSPVGACPDCRGFGRIIKTDYKLVIPDESLSIKQGAIRPFQGNVYGECQEELIRIAKKNKVSITEPWGKLSKREKAYIIEGDSNYVEGNKKWYGIKRFFKWLESNTYKMHIRIFLSKYRKYSLCPQCNGSRLQEEALLWKWQNHTLPDLYQISVSSLHELLSSNPSKLKHHQADLSREAILKRLSYLQQVGLGYLTLDRTSRTLSGGEVQRVNLTACLGTSLTDTLFILDEPTVGLHSRDIHRLVEILQQLVHAGNTVIVVEHDESVMRAADHIIEIGEKPGREGGNIVFTGSPQKITQKKNSITGDYLSGKKTIRRMDFKRTKLIKKTTAQLLIRNASHNNIQNLNLSIPLKRLVTISGVSGSGKSTLLNDIIFKNLNKHASVKSTDSIDEVVLINQSAVSKTPRSTPIVYTDGWDPIKNIFAKTESAKSAGLIASHFSFNSGVGRCEHCNGLGSESIEMQFLSNVYIDCAVCNGSRYKDEVLNIQYKGKTISDVLNMTAEEALVFFEGEKKICTRLSSLIDVGLDYLLLGQPLNTLSGGESQRLKLIKHLPTRDEKKHSLILLDEPTTGLHRHDVKNLLNVFFKLIDQGHSIIAIEHQMDVLCSSDWIIEMGPSAGTEGGKVVAETTPEKLAKLSFPSSPFLKFHLNQDFSKKAKPSSKKTILKATNLTITGAREHNLKNVSLEIPNKKISVITGVSGSGKSSLAFDIIFAEGQRRFMESMSSYSRQFVEQMPKPDVDRITNIPPSAAIAQRVSRGSRKSTVATVTEVAHFLRLLFAKIGIQYNPKTNNAVTSISLSELKKHALKNIKQQRKQKHLYLCAPVIRGRKGHHEPLANWAKKKGYKQLRCDGEIIQTDQFKKLDRYSEHDVEIIIADFGIKKNSNHTEKDIGSFLDEAITLGKGSCLLLNDIDSHWLSIHKTDPETGESFPELDPKNFSWNSPRGWCPECKGYGRIYEEEECILSTICPKCEGSKLNKNSSFVKIKLKNGHTLSLPDLLKCTSGNLLKQLSKLQLNSREKAIATDILPQIKERLLFMDKVGIDYLAFDRDATTLSGGEAQRIRLAAQLGSNLSGVLYILDEPSIGLHAKDNEQLIKSLIDLKEKGNTILVVEHDEEIMRQADHLIDIGPLAGIHGGEIIAEGTPTQVLKNKHSLTAKFLKSGIKHPINGKYRILPPQKEQGSTKHISWITAKKTALRNLKGDDLFLPLNKLICVCGPSGAGKSTLIRDLIKPSVLQACKAKKAVLTGKALFESGVINNDHSKETVISRLINGHLFDQIIEVDQSPIGKTPRSIPATYLGAFDIIRNYFANLPEANMRGHTSSTFSFNTPGGRCETCNGGGRIKLEMNFMPDTYIDCDECNGSRYSDDLNDIRWNQKSISEILDMTFQEATSFFSFHTRLKAMMELMNETGLGYLKLGQSSPSLSGGEAQRLKLVSELSKGSPSFTQLKRGTHKQNLYILEEPTIGLHASDCEKLLETLHRLVNQGHTVIVIEHNLDVLMEADYIVEVGPKGGDEGGRITYQGNLSGLLKKKNSATAPFLRKLQLV